MSKRRFKGPIRKLVPRQLWAVVGNCTGSVQDVLPTKYEATESARRLSRNSPFIGLYRVEKVTVTTP